MTNLDFSAKSASFFLRIAHKVMAKFGSYRVGSRTFETAGECADHICDKLVRRNPAQLESPDTLAEVKFMTENAAVLRGEGTEADEAEAVYRHEVLGGELKSLENKVDQQF